MTEDLQQIVDNCDKHIRLLKDEAVTNKIKMRVFRANRLKAIKRLREIEKAGVK